MKLDKDINSILLAIYLWSFGILKFFWYYNSNFSAIILFLISLSVISTSFFYSNNKFNRNIFLYIYMLIFVFSLLFVDVFFRSNTFLYTRIYEFLIYGVVPVYLFSQIKDFKYFLKTYMYLSIISFMLYILDPFNNYRYTLDYMVFGFQLMLPTFIGLHIGRIKFKKKYLIFLEAMTFLMIIFFGNRGASVACIFFILVVDLLYTKKYFLKNIKYLISFIVVVVTFMNLKQILTFFVNKIFMLGIYSYSLNSIVLYLNGTSSALLSGRDSIWEDAILLIKQRFFLGWGTGYFETVHGMYVHNFILEILLSYGIIILLLVLFLLINSIYNIFVTDGDAKLFGIVIFCTSFPKLLTSVYIFSEPTFWIFLMYGLFFESK